MQLKATRNLQPAQVNLSQVVEWELGDERLAEPELARRLGELVTPRFLKDLDQRQSEERAEPEHEVLRELLGKVQFLAADGTWHQASDLLVAQINGFGAPQADRTAGRTLAPQPPVVAAGEGVDSDEQMRAAFAPPECRLHPDYSGPALAFFLACRPQLDADAKTMAEWVL